MYECLLYVRLYVCMYACYMHAFMYVRIPIRVCMHVRVCNVYIYAGSRHRRLPKPKKSVTEVLKQSRVEALVKMVWYGMVWYGIGMVWYGMVWYGWYGMM